MKKLVFLAVAAITFSACNNGQDRGHGHHRFTAAYMDSLNHELLSADLAFSKMSEEKGRSAAFLQYAADNATVLRPFSHPVTGRDAMKAMFANHPDSIYSLTWVPVSSDVARSGEIGYTYGTYQLDVKNAGHEAGTYCTVWHKDSTKTWKFALTTGNEGLDPAEKTDDAKIDARKK